MTSKYVQDTNAAKSISAYVILRGTSEVATVTVYYGDSRVLVNVFQRTEAVRRCGKAVKISDDRKAYDRFGFQHASASGYGYDKKAAALSGLMIDGRAMTDHCQGSKKKPAETKGWPRDAKAPKGWHFANWSTEHNVWRDCYRKTGLDYLEAIGYRVIQAV